MTRSIHSRLGRSAGSSMLRRLLAQVAIVGDGANDLPMLALAGLGIAFQTKPIVRERAQHASSNLGLDGILYLLGVRDREW